MKQLSGATSLAEGQYEFKTDVNLIFGDLYQERNHILRTTFHSLPVWKTRNPKVCLSPFEGKVASLTKHAAIIDQEIWVYDINSSSAQDIEMAVELASQYYKVKPSVILSDIYAKNMNADGEADMTNQALIKANESLYADTCIALTAAAKQLGISTELNFYIFSSNKNHKIPQSNLVNALQTGGASSVITDDHRPRVTVGNNQGTRKIKQFTNFHLATLKA